MAQDYNLVRPRVVQHAHKVLAVLVRYHDSLFRGSCCSETRRSQQFWPSFCLLATRSDKNAEVIIQRKRGAHGDRGHLWMGPVVGPCVAAGGDVAPWAGSDRRTPAWTTTPGCSCKSREEGIRRLTV